MKGFELHPLDPRDPLQKSMLDFTTKWPKSAAQSSYKVFSQINLGLSFFRAEQLTVKGTDSGARLARVKPNTAIRQLCDLH